MRRFVVFHRHGHRAPASNLFGADEVKTWNELLPSPQISNSLKIINENVKQPKDITSKPFGCLTQKGLSHLQAVGRKHVDLLPSRLDVHSLSVYATNYERTQLSGSMFLEGLGFGPANITVRRIDECAMTFYDGNPVARRVIMMSQASSEYRALVESQEVVAMSKGLISIFPSLLKCTASTRTNSSTAIPIDWMSAFDYYQCRRAHSLPLLPEAEAFEYNVKKHISYRFRLYYSAQSHLSHVAVPLLKDLLVGLVGEGLHPAGDAVTVFSGHDVTILALLYALKADVLNDPIYWPDYGCVLLFQTFGSKVQVSLDSQPAVTRLGSDHHHFTIEELKARIEELQKHLGDVDKISI